MALSKGEGIQLAGKVLVKVGEAFENDDVVSKEEIFEIVQFAILEALKEYSD